MLFLKDWWGDIHGDNCNEDISHNPGLNFLLAVNARLTINYANHS